MSWQASDWMDRLPFEAAKPLATRVLLKLANVAAQDGTRAYRNVWEMADELGVDRRSIQRALRELQTADLIRPGDQRAVAHIPGNRRPTVYNLNFGYSRMYAQPDLPLPDDELEDEYPAEIEPDLGATLGAAELSTGDSGATLGAAAEVPLGTKRTYLTTDIENTYVGNRAQAHDEAASGDSHRPANAKPSPVWSAERCPAEYKNGAHELGNYGHCLHCHEKPTWHRPPYLPPGAGSSSGAQA